MALARGTNVRVVVSALIAVAFAWLALAGQGEAQSRTRTTLKITPPSEGAIGEQMTITAVLSDQAGSPVSGARVRFLREVSFLNSTSEVEVGTAVTDALGIATIQYAPSSEGETLLLADFAGDARYSPSSSSASVFVATGPPLYFEEQGIKVPGINVSFLVAILFGVWATYFTVMAHILLIARKSSAGGHAEAANE